MKKIIAGFAACAALSSVCAWAGNASVDVGQGTVLQGSTAVQWVAGVKQFLASEQAQGEIGNDLAEIKSGGLPSSARQMYAQYKKAFAPDFPPTAYTVDEVAGGTAYLVYEMTDGATYMSVFDASGKLVASGMAGEGEDFIWDATPQAPSLP